MDIGVLLHGLTSSVGRLPAGDPGGSTSPGGSSKGSNSTWVCLMLRPHTASTAPRRHGADWARMRTGCTPMDHVPNVLKGSELVVHKGGVDLRQHLQALHHFPKHRVLAVKVVDVVTGGDVKLAARTQVD